MGIWGSCAALHRAGAVLHGGGEDAGEAISVLWRGLRAMLQTGRGGQPLFISMQVARRWLVTACSASPVSHSELQVKKAGKNTQIYA